MRNEKIVLSLNQRTLRKAEHLAAERGSSIGELLAERIEILFGSDEDYEQRQASALLDQGFHPGGVISGNQHDWHER